MTRKPAAGSRQPPAGNVALTVRHPWAWAIAAGLKDVENRSWPTSYRGPLLIHAAKKLDRAGITEMRRRYGIEVPLDELVFGAFVARVQLVDVVRNSDSPWAIRGMFHFLLDRAHRFAHPVEYPGRLGLFDPHAHTRQRARQLRLSPMGDSEAWDAFVRTLTPLS